MCFPAHGWIHDGTVTSEITSSSGRPISCLIHRFHKPAPSFQEIVVLSFYILNGQITLSENDFSGLLGRRPNVSGDPARYVAQVQISSVYENSIRTAAAQMADTILAFLPDQKGHQGAADLGGQWEPQTRRLAFGSGRQIRRIGLGARTQFTPAGKTAEGSRGQLVVGPGF